MERWWRWKKLVSVPELYNTVSHDNGRMKRRIDELCWVLLLVRSGVPGQTITIAGAGGCRFSPLSSHPHSTCIYDLINISSVMAVNADKHIGITLHFSSLSGFCGKFILREHSTHAHTHFVLSKYSLRILEIFSCARGHIASSGDYRSGKTRQFRVGLWMFRDSNARMPVMEEGNTTWHCHPSLHF